MSKPDGDPYYSLRDTVQDRIERIQTNYKKFNNLLKTVDTSSSSEFKDIRKSLRTDIRSADDELKALKSMVDTIEKNRGSYVTIKDAELANRKKFVENGRTTIQGVKDNYDSPDVRKKIEEDKARNTHSNNPMRESLDSRDQQVNNENETFIRGQQKVTKDQIQQQDVQLGKLDSALDVVHQQSRLINEEVKQQGHMLNALEKDVDTANDKMNVVLETIGKLLRTKDSCQIWTIIILGLVLILLVALVIWT